MQQNETEKLPVLSRLIRGANKQAHDCSLDDKHGICIEVPKDPMVKGRIIGVSSVL